MRLEIDKISLAKGEAIPKYYGYAYTDIITDMRVYYLIPVNFIVAIWRKISFKLRHGFRDKVYKQVRSKSEFQEGYDMGFSAAVHWVDLNLDFIPVLLTRARELYELPAAPEGLQGCRDCISLDNLIATTGLAKL